MFVFDNMGKELLDKVVGGLKVPSHSIVHSLHGLETLKADKLQRFTSVSFSLEENVLAVFSEHLTTFCVLDLYDDIICPLANSIQDIHEHLQHVKDPVPIIRFHSIEKDLRKNLNDGDDLHVRQKLLYRDIRDNLLSTLSECFDMT